MTLADELRDILARDDAFELRLFVRAHSCDILGGLVFMDALYESACKEVAAEVVKAIAPIYISEQHLRERLILAGRRERD